MLNIIKELKDIKGIKLHIHPTFNYSFENMLNEWDYITYYIKKYNL